MSVLSRVAQQMRVKHAKHFEYCAKNVAEAQTQKLLSILDFNKDTAYGQTHGFESISSVAEYQSRVPIVTYEDIQPLIEKMRQGESRQLTAEDPIYWCQTTGSTGPRKFSPVTPAYRDEYQSVVHTFLYYVYQDHPRAFEGKVLYFNGSAKESQAPTGLDCGTMSGFNFTQLPKLLQKFYALPYEITDISHPWSKRYVSALLALQKPISMMIGVTGAPIIAFLKAMRANFPALINDIHQGTLHADLILTPEQRRLILKEHKPNPKRAKALAELMEKDTLDPQSIWPSLDLVTCWKSSHAGSFIPELNSLLENKVAIRDAVYSATEGWCNIPMKDDLVGGPMAVQAHFYEFIPAESEDNAPLLLAQELQEGEQYRILFTTSCGMYRYDIGDILEVVGFYHQSPIMKFVRKVGQSCNLLGEKLNSAQITQCMVELAEENDWTLPFYLVMPTPQASPPGYTLYIEPPAGVSAQFLAKALDEKLRMLNHEYGIVRKGEQLSLMQGVTMGPDTLATFQALRHKDGMDPMQMKPIVLSDDPALLEGLEQL